MWETVSDRVKEPAVPLTSKLTMLLETTFRWTNCWHDYSKQLVKSFSRQEWILEGDYMICLQTGQHCVKTVGFTRSSTQKDGWDSKDECLCISVISGKVACVSSFDTEMCNASVWLWHAIIEWRFWISQHLAGPQTSWFAMNHKVGYNFMKWKFETWLYQRRVRGQPEIWVLRLFWR